MQLSQINKPTLLTLIRLIVSPLFLPIALVYLTPFNNLIINYFLAAAFILFSLTDFFDGYLARKYSQVTYLGKALDPIADKFLFFSTLVALVAVNKIYFFTAILFIGREFLVMGLRILSLEQGSDIPVSIWGKVKTIVLAIYITFIIVNTAYSSETIGYWYTYYFLLTLSLFLSLYSAYRYTYQFIQKTNFGIIQG